MFRRSRFSIRPNVGSAGRAAATPQEAPAASQEAGETPKDIGDSNTATAVTENKPDVTPAEKPAASGDRNDQNGEGTSTSAAVQRRKRFSIKPKVAPGRLSSLARTPKSPAKACSGTPAETYVSDLDKPTTSSQTGPTVSPRGLQSPRRRRPSEDSKQLKVQPKPTDISLDSSGPSAVPRVEDLEEQTPLPADSGKQFESTSDSLVKEAPSRLSDKVPPSLPDKEAIEISEKAKTLVSSKSDLSLSAPAYSLSRLLNDPSDMQRIAKAQKLRDLLRKEMHKEKNKKKNKKKNKVGFSLDPAKMTMRDLIRYLPESNPMTSTLEETVNENETVIPPSPGREESPERAQEPEAAPKVSTPREEEEEEAEAEPQEDQDEDEEALMVPQVKVAEDGTLIIDEESLTVEVQRAKGPNPAQDRDPIFERGSTTTYSSFRKGTYTKPWSSEETDMFFLAISMVGTDFSMICQLFPHRARSEIKNKFKKEERANSWRIDKAFRERRKLDIEYFSKLLEKILEVQKNRKKLKALANKNSKNSKKQKKKTKGKKAAKMLSDVEEENEEEENDIPDLEGEGEKENEALCNEGESPVSKPKKKRKQKNDASKEEPKKKKKKSDEKGSEQDEACIPEDSEAALPEDHTNPDMSEKSEDTNAAKDAAIKPAKLSRGRAPKPLLPLGRKWGKKLPQPSTKAGEASADKEDKSVTDEASKEQANKDSSPLKQANKKKSEDDGDSSEEEESTAPPPRPTRYGRIPKPIKPLTYPAKEETHSSASESTPASPAAASSSTAKPKSKPAAKRARPSKVQPVQESKKPKLVTLRASQSDSSDDENDHQWEEYEAEEEQHLASGNDSIASAFVPASLRSQHPLISEVEETMEELEILANMPDVLGISQDALCPDASCELAQNETGTAEPCEHQLDLLVDVIEFLSADHSEASEDQSYNEAAQTLLTIGNLAHLSHPAQNQTIETTSVSVSETSQHPQEETEMKPVAQEEGSITAFESAASGSGVTEAVPALEIQKSTADADNVQTIGQQVDSEVDSATKLQAIPEDSKTDSPQAKKGRLSKVKPKPNLGRASRAAQVKSGPKTSTAEEVHKGNDVPSQLEVKPTDEPSDRQERSAAGTSDPESHGLEVTRDLGSTNVVPNSHVGTVRSSTNDVGISDCVVTDPQIQQVTDTSPTSVEKSSESPASGDTPVEDLPHPQKEETEDSPASQTRKNRYQRVKPKPNLAQTSRMVRSKPQTTDDTSEKDSNLTPKEHEEAKEVPAEPTPSPEKPSLNQEFSLTEAGCSNPLKPDSKVTKAQSKQESSRDCTSVVSVEVLSVGQKKESEDESTSQTRKSRFQRVKPKPNLAQTSRTVRSKPPIAEETKAEDSNPNSGTSGEPTHTTSTEISSQGIGTTSALPLNLDSSLSTTEELLKTELEIQDIWVESGAETSSQSSSEDQTYSQVQYEPIKEQATMDKSPTSEGNTAFHVGESESSWSDLLTLGQVGEEGSQGDSEPIQETSNQPASCSTHVEEAPASQEQESEDPSTSQTRRSRYQRVKPKPKLAQTSRSVRSKPQTTGETSEKDSKLTPCPKELEESKEVPAEPTPSPEKPSLNQEFSLTEAGCSNPLKPDSKVTKAQSEQESSRDCTTVVSVEVLSVGQKKESEDESTSQTRKSRFQRVKPKPNLAQTSRTVRSKPPIAEETKAEDSNPTTNPNSGTSGEPAHTTSTAISSQGIGTTSALLLNLDSPLPTTEELFKTELDIKDIWVESGAETCSQSSSDDQTYASCSTNVEEVPASQEQESEDPSTSQTRRSRYQRVKPKPKLAQTPRTVRSKPQTSKDITNKDTVLTPDPSRTKADIPVSTISPENTCPSPGPSPSLESDCTPVSLSLEKPSPGPASVSVPSLELSSAEKLTGELSSAEEPVSDVGLDSSLEGSQQNVPQRRQRFPKVKPKPNIGSSVKGRRTKKTQAGGPSEQGHMDNTGAERELKPTEQDSENLKIGLVGSEESGSVESGTASPFTEDLSLFSNSVLQNKSTETTTAEEGSEGDKLSHDQVEAETSSLWDTSQDLFIEAMDTNTESTEETAETVGVWSLETVQQCSETDQPTSQSSQDDHLEPTNSPKSPIKAPQSRRGWSMKPKPNLGRRRQPPQIEEAQPIKETQAEADSDSGSVGVNASVSHKPVSELQPEIQDPLKEVLEHSITQSSPLIVAESPLGCASQVTDSSTQDAPSSSAEGTQNLPSLSLFPDMLSGQLPLDPDEPFFTLCLTEIPVCSSGGVLESVAEVHPYTPVTDTSVQQQSDAGVNVAAVDSEPLFKVAVPESGEEKDPVTVKDPEPDSAACTDLIIEDPVKPEGSTAVQSPRIPETREGKDETEIPPTKQRLQGTTRRAKQQVKPKTSRKKQASEVDTAEEDDVILVETNTTEESELPGFSVQQRGYDEGVSEQQEKGNNRKSTAKRAVTASKDPEESVSGAQKRQTRGARSRKPPGSLSENKSSAPPSDPPPAKADRAKTPRAGRRQSTSKAATSTSNVAHASSTTLPTRTELDTEPAFDFPLRSDSPLNASQSSVGASSSQQSLDASSIEDATSVSQYFLSDIFTDAEEG
ncbi:transcription factor TFIIIB component B'' homolog isoform X3 [Xyrichtys novacula]|nr:transcription factor TFIIIB component B'' homolog isoform X3 [Xyrichtys novacula]